MATTTQTQNTEEQNKPTIYRDTLKDLYYRALESLTPETQAIKNNLTATFKLWIKEKIKSKELIVIQIRGEVRTGKSTVGITIAWDINKYMQQIQLNPTAEQYMWKWIFSDQTEFLRFINGDERNVGLCIDEFNTLAKTGINSTTEEALLDHYSDIFAGQYLHRVSMGTDIIIDKNTTVILDTIGKDERKQITRCKLSYRDVVTKKILCIGHVDIDTSQLIKNWINQGIRELIETKGQNTPKEQQKINEWKQKDFYIKYQVKKYKRMELLKKEGIRDIRELEFAEIILDCLLELQQAERITPQQRETIAQQTQEQTTQEQTQEQTKQQLKLPRQTEQKETTEPTQQQSQQEIQKATQKYKRSGSIATAQEQLNGGKISEITFTPTDNISNLRNTYETLLRNSKISTTDKYGNEDQALIDILIENREKLQHRFTAEITITTTGGTGHINIDGILAEHLNEIYDYIQIGQTYTSQELKEKMTEAQRHFEKQHGSIGGQITPPPEKKSTITDIQIKMTFA